MRFLCTLLLFGLTLASSAQTKYTVSGVVKDAKTGEELIGAVVFVKDQPSLGASTNNYGFYSLTLPAGNYTLVYKYLGYENNEQSILLSADKTINLELSEQKKQLDEVVVTDKQAVERVQDKKISVVAMDIKSIKAVPALFGEVDILKTIQLLPGIQGAGEGNAGLNVRGGASDQNLILLDEAPVYNASHLMGFFFGVQFGCHQGPGSIQRRYSSQIRRTFIIAYRRAYARWKLQAVRPDGWYRYHCQPTDGGRPYI